MKKLAILSVVFLGLFLTSCEAEDITENDYDQEQLIDKDEIETAADEK